MTTPRTTICPSDGRAWARRACLALLVSGTPAFAQRAVEPPIPALLEPTFLLSTGKIVESADDLGAGSIVGTTREMGIRDQSLTASDQVFVPHPLDGEVLEIGDVVQFYRVERRINDPLTGERLGSLIVPTGIGNVDSLTGDVARVRVTHAFLPILVGDRARAVIERDTLVSVAEAPGTQTDGHVVAFQEEKAIVPPFDRLFVRPGEAASLVPGQVLWLYRPASLTDGRSLPEAPIGRAMVVRVDGDTAAVVLFEVFRSDLVPGDRFRDGS